MSSATRSCSVAGCSGKHEARGYCAKHYQQVKRHGAVGAGRWEQKPERTYVTAHYRVRRDRGPAPEQTCACGAPAAEWAYDHNDPDELIGEDHGKAVPYSLDVAHYLPMCVPCHRQFDYDHSNQMEAVR